MASKAVIPFLISMMLLTGVCNTLLTKYQDMQCVRDCGVSDHGGYKTAYKTFEQPVIQTVQMFIGESGCWLVVLGFWIHKRYIANKDAPMLYSTIAQEDEQDGLLERSTSVENAHPAVKAMIAKTEDRTELAGWKITLLALPACCDITGTTLMNVGLLFVAASIYQMTRGALVLFVGVFSVVFLRRKLFLYHWFSLFLVVVGVGLVGLAGALFRGDKNPAEPILPGHGDENEHDLVRAALHMARDVAVQAAEPAVLHTVLGIFLIAFAQVFTATQFCLEEWILENYALEPLKVVAWEGSFGLLVTLLGQLILHFTVGTSNVGRDGYFDAREGYKEVFDNRAILITSFLIMISIGGFNFFGLSVTRTISATSRSIIDTCRTLFIWIVSLALGWESFKWLQVVGFALLVYGTFMFNDLVRPPLKACMPQRKDLETRGELLPEEPIEHM
jgi:drug/metabolite transporter (DMT)-like permease